MIHHGVDLSNHNDYDIVRNPDNFDFFIMKVSEGISFTDSKVAGWIAQCEKMNRRYGVYHFFHGNGKSEALYFMNAAHSVGYRHLGGNIIPFLDAETGGQGSEREVMLFRDTIHKMWGTVPGYYSYLAYINSYAYSAEITNMPLWYSNPSGNPVPAPWKSAAIVQTATGGTLDLDSASHLPTIVTPPTIANWIVHHDDKIVGRTIHPHIWEARHVMRFGNKHHQLGFRRIS